MNDMERVLYLRMCGMFDHRRYGFTMSRTVSRNDAVVRFVYDHKYDKILADDRSNMIFQDGILPVVVI